MHLRPHCIRRLLHKTKCIYFKLRRQVNCFPNFPQQTQFSLLNSCHPLHLGQVPKPPTMPPFTCDKCYQRNLLQHSDQLEEWSNSNNDRTSFFFLQKRTFLCLTCRGYTCWYWSVSWSFANANALSIAFYMFTVWYKAILGPFAISCPDLCWHYCVWWSGPWLWFFSFAAFSLRSQPGSQVVWVDTGDAAHWQRYDEKKSGKTPSNVHLKISETGQML